MQEVTELPAHTVLYPLQKMFLSDLLTYAKEQAKIEFRDYCDLDPRFRTAHEVSAWQLDRSRRDNSRKQLFKFFCNRIRNASKEQLVPGNYGRLTISESGIEYTAGQYPPTEIYGALFNYMQQTN